MLRGIGPTGRMQDSPGHRCAITAGFLDRNVRRALLCSLIAAVVGPTCGCGFFERDQELAVVAREATGPRIVVLPFANPGPESDAFFAAGLTEEIEERLGAVTEIIVISDSGGNVIEDSDDATRRIGDELGAEYVLAGTVQRSSEGGADTRLLADFRLVRVNDSEVLWSESYDRSMADVFAVQADVALTVLDRLGVGVQPATRALIERHSTDSLDAYEAYLHGLPNRWSFELGELGTAGEFFTRAVELDPDFASAYVALSENHSQIFHFRGDRSPQRLANAIAAALRALEIQPDLPEGHRALGLYYYWGQRNYKQALSEFSLAAAGRPNDPLIISSIGLVLRRQGRWPEAMDAFLRVSQLDPKRRYQRRRPGLHVRPDASLRGRDEVLPPRHRPRPRTTSFLTSSWRRSLRTGQRFDRRGTRGARGDARQGPGATGLFPVRTGALRTGLRGWFGVVGADRGVDL